MKVDKTHRLYDLYEKKWRMMRDAVEGEEAIKARGEEYLPMPPGLGDGINSRAYNNYKARARYPDFVAPAIEGFCGLMSRKVKDPELPKGLKYLENEATPDGLSLRDLRDYVEHEVTTVGRIALFIDLKENGGVPYITQYAAENFINWRVEGDRVVLAVFFEESEEPDPVDPFVVHYISQWRVASMEQQKNGGEVYTVKVYRRRKDPKPDEDQFYVYSETYPNHQGETLKEVPIAIIGSRDVDPEPDAIPLMSVAIKSLHYFRQYADYAMQLFMCANGTTPYVTGAKKNESPATVGPTTIWEFEDAGAKVGYLEVSGTGLEAQEGELENIKTEISYATVRILGDKKAAEAAETLRIRFQSQTATLSSISRACMSGLKKALTFCAEWVNADPDGIKADGAAEFVTEELDAGILKALYDGIERGLVPDELLIEYTRRAELHDKTLDEYRQWSAGLLAEGEGEEGFEGG